MQAGDEDTAVKTFEYDSFKMEVQKKSKEEFSKLGEN